MKQRKGRTGYKTHAWLIAILVLLAVPTYAAYSHRSSDHPPLTAETAPTGSSDTASAEAAFQMLPEIAPVPGSLKIPIFIYHSVRPHIDGESALEDAYDVTPELLDQQLSYLDKHGYTAITMDQFVEYVNQGYSPALKPVVLSFDDGWRNQYVYAFPLLKKYHMTATFYIYTNPIDHDKPHFLSWDMVREMDQAGMTIASHSVTHPLLTKLGPDELTKELTLSKTRLQTELGHSVIHFASPFGSTSNLIQATAKGAGYVTARTTYRGVYHAPSDLMHLRGILVDDRLSDFVSVLETH